MTQPTEYWFKPRSYGYGAAPINWKGWAVTAAYVLAIWLFAVFFAPPRGDAATWNDFAIWLGGIAIITLPFIWLCRVKTDGKWRWNWGNK